MPYKATHAMGAATESGEIVKYKVGDIIPDVESWPTFEQLKNIEWIVATSDDDEVPSGDQDGRARRHREDTLAIPGKAPAGRRRRH